MKRERSPNWLRLGVVALVLLILVASCERGRTVSEPESRLRYEALLQTLRLPSTPIGLDDYFVLVAEREPAFAGLHFGSDGRLNVSLVDTGRLPDALDAIYDIMEARGDLRTAEKTARPAEYSFLELYDWRLRLNALTSIKGAISVGIDEVRNRVSVHISDEGVRSAVSALLDELDIPTEAVLVEIGRMPQLSGAPVAGSQTLQDYVRGLFGGAEIETADGGVTWSCTLGYNAYRWNGSAYDSVFFTNAHCMDIWGSSNSTGVWQDTRNVQNEYIGAENQQGRLISDAESAYCPVEEYECKFSDVAMGMANQDVIRALWQVEGGRDADSSSLVIDWGDALFVSGINLFALEGDTINKVGKRTGWTYGVVNDTCRTLTTPLQRGGGDATAYYFVCFETADGGSNSGDSGSAVFFWDESENEAEIIGQLWGGTGGDSIFFSGLGNVHWDLNTPLLDYTP